MAVMPGRTLTVVFSENDLKPWRVIASRRMRDLCMENREIPKKNTSHGGSPPPPPPVEAALGRHWGPDPRVAPAVAGLRAARLGWMSQAAAAPPAASRSSPGPRAEATLSTSVTAQTRKMRRLGQPPFHDGARRLRHEALRPHHGRAQHVADLGAMSAGPSSIMPRGRSSPRAVMTQGPTGPAAHGQQQATEVRLGVRTPRCGRQVM